MRSRGVPQQGWNPGAHRFYGPKMRCAALALNLAVTVLPKTRCISLQEALVISAVTGTPVQSTVTLTSGPLLV